MVRAAEIEWYDLAMRAIGALALLVVSSATAAAENDVNPPGREIDREPDVYVSSGLITGTDHFKFGGFVLEAGRRIGRFRDTPLFIRAMGHGGNTRVEGNPGRGTYLEARAGLEGRNCTRTGMLCASVGLDLGLHRGRYEHVDLDDNGRPIGKPIADEMTTDAYETFNSTVVAPRLTLDGGNRVRMRAVIERPYHISKEGGVGGLSGSLMLGLAF